MITSHKCLHWQGNCIKAWMKAEERLSMTDAKLITQSWRTGLYSQVKDLQTRTKDILGIGNQIHPMVRSSSV